MSTLYENYTTGDDQIEDTWGTIWKAMSFTPSAAHAITKVRLLLNRWGSPGTLTVSIRATSGGFPIGGDLTSGAIDGNALTTNGLGAWYDIDLTQYNLLAGVEYAIVIRSQGVDDENIVGWRRDRVDGTYTDGGSSTSVNSGGSWAEVGDDGVATDYLFEEWGVAVTAPTVTTDPATSVGPAQATINGTLDDDGGEAGDCGFEWGRDTDYGNITPTQNKVTGETFSQGIIGLEPNTIYHFRAIGTNSTGGSTGADIEFTTIKGMAEYWYHLNIKNINLPYEDLDKTKEIHVILTNLSPTAKMAGVYGRVKIKIDYEPTA